MRIESSNEKMGTGTKRKFIRVDLLQQVYLEFENMNYTSCRITNLSLTGMFVAGSIYQQTGDDCVVRYSRRCNASRFSFKAKARVVRTTGNGIAVEFLSMPIEDYIQLQTTLLYEAADPLAIGLELPDHCPFDVTRELPGDVGRSVHSAFC